MGLSVPHEWWSSAPLVKSYEAAGFAWAQLHAPPVAVLANPRLCTRHAAGARAALATTGLAAILGSQDVEAWIIGIVVSGLSVILAAIVWSARV